MASVKRADLERLNKPEIQIMANDLGIITKGLSKAQLVEAILDCLSHPLPSRPPTPVEAKGGDSSPKTPNAASVIHSGLSTEHLNFELRKVQIESNTKLELRKLEMQHERDMWALRSAGNAHTGSTTFRIEAAIKSMPKLVNESEIDCYLVTFEKIAVLNNWPKDQWSALLQTQLRGKGLKVFSELSNADCKQYDVLKKALLTAYEFSSEVYRKRFRSLTKSLNETYSDFAFKLTNAAKRWLTSVNAFDDINALQQTLLMEQFAESLPVEINLWLVDKKLKSIDEMARAVDQYSSLRKAVITNDMHSNDSSVLNTYRSESKHTSYSAKPVSYKDTQHTFVKTGPKFKGPIKCFYCELPNHTISECRLRQKHEKSKNDAKHSPVNENMLIGDHGRHTACNSAAIEGDLFTSGESVLCMDGILPVFPLHPLFAPFCKQATIDYMSIIRRLDSQTGSIIRRFLTKPHTCLNPNVTVQRHFHTNRLTIEPV
jgi:hypothetical protein